MLFPDAQAEFQDQEFYWNQRTRSKNPGLDNTLCHIADKIFEIFVESRIAFLHTGDVCKTEYLHLHWFTEIIGSSFYKASGTGKFSTGIFILGQRFHQRGSTFEKSCKFKAAERGCTSNYTILKVVRTGVIWCNTAGAWYNFATAARLFAMNTTERELRNRQVWTAVFLTPELRAL